MSYEVKYEQKAGYLHATVTGVNTKENVMRYLTDISHECEARDCFRVLIEEDLEGPRLGMMDVFEIASTGQNKGAARLPVIAYVDVNADSASMKFAEDVAVNRGIGVRVFSSTAAAAHWLQDPDGPATEPDTETDAGRPCR